MQIRKILERMNRGKRQGWWSSPSYTIEDTKARCNLTDEQWDGLTWMERSRKIARLRASDTMQAWDSLSDEDKRKWRMVTLSESALKP